MALRIAIGLAITVVGLALVVWRGWFLYRLVASGPAAVPPRMRDVPAQLKAELLEVREADGVVLSILLGVSQVAHVAETASRLQAVGANLVGAIINGVWNKAYQAGYEYSSAAAAQTVPAIPAEEPR